MAAEDLTALLSVPGRLALGPTDLTTDYPYGGTALGLVRDVLASVVTSPVLLTAEEWGGEPFDVIEDGESWAISFAVRADDSAALALAFLEVGTGGTTGLPAVDLPAPNRRSGRLRAQDGQVFLFAPLDTARHRALLFRRAVPWRVERLAMPLEWDGANGDELTYAIRLVAVRDDDGVAVQHRMLADLTLADP